MKTLITCGTPWCDLRSVQGTLESAGLAKLKAASAGSVATIDTWHDRLFVGQPGVPQVLHPGKAWELAAGEIFLANWDLPEWGWADSRSSWLLDFWRDFDPNTCFVLLHTPAYDVLASAVANAENLEFDGQALLSNWCAYQIEFLRFYQRNRARCVLTHAHSAGRQSAKWIASINEALGTNLVAATGSNTKRSPVDPMVHLWVTTLLQANTQVLALEDEMRATLTAGDGDCIQAPQALDLAAAGGSWRTLVQSNVQLKQTHAELEGLVQQGQQTLAQQDSLALEKLAHIAQLDHAALQSEQLRQSTLQESNLLLEQLHQVQEEFEKHFSQSQELGAQLKAAQLERDTLGKDKAEAIAQRDAFSKDKTTLTAARDAEAKAKTEAITQRDALAKDNTTLTAARDAQTKVKTETLAKSGKAEQQQLKAQQELQQESNLLLEQLHQVQEELESYFLQHQQVTQEKQQLLTRWNKLLCHYPDYAEWERIDVIPGTAKKAKATRLHSHIVGLQAMGRSVSLLDITVDLAGNFPTLLLAPPQTGASPLAYWPVAFDETGAAALAPLRLDPAAPYASEAASLLRSMALSDIQLIGTACTALTEGLTATLPDRALWLQHIAVLRQEFAMLPPTWRFESVQLKHQQVNPDYENLWFQCTNASYGPRQWPNFEFRLSASNVRRGKFSHLPKLEFPLQEQGDHQFENWFEEAEDDRGPKFELRFDTKNQAMDTNLWDALSPLDQAQALSLCEQLPNVLHRLQAQGVRIARPWSDWHTMVLNTQKVLARFVTQAAALEDATA